MNRLLGPAHTAAVNGAELVQLTEAARAFGDLDEAEGDGARDPGGGRRPGDAPWPPPDTDGSAAEDRAADGQTATASSEPTTEAGWSLPSRALAAIAEREGWPLDLTGGDRPRSPVPDQLSRYVSETLAAHAAVVLAKTQATAARAEAQTATRRMQRASADADVERTRRERVEAQLAEARAAEAELDKQLAVATARTEEIRTQLDFERQQRAYLSQRIGALEADRDTLRESLGWAGRRRLQAKRR